MKQLWKKTLAMSLAGTMVLTMSVPAFASENTDTTEGEVTVEEGDTPFLALGADLKDSEKAAVLDLMGISEDDLSKYDVVTVTNEQEHKYLDSYLDSSVIGSRALSSVVVMQGEEGSGIHVTTHNITYCTTGMYENAMATAGMTDAEVIVAGPFDISGTAALVGAIEAYSVMTGEEVDESVIDGAVQEIVVTGDIEQNSDEDSEAVEGMVAYLKEQLEDSKGMSDDELQQAIEDAEKEFDVNLTQDQIDELISLLKKLQGLNLDWDSIGKQAQNIYSTLQGMGFDLSNIDSEQAAQTAATWFDQIIAFIKNLLHLS